MEKTDTCHKVFLYSKGTFKQIMSSNRILLIVQEAMRLPAQADNIYLKSISESDIDNFREDKCVEILLAQPKEIIIQAIKQGRTVSKILIPLGESMCKKHAHILFGDPDYKPFNLFLNSEGCGKLQKIINNRIYPKFT